MNRLVVVTLALAACGPSLTPQARSLSRMFADARRDDKAFAAHFDPSMSSDAVNRWRETFSTETPPEFDLDGPVCVRAVWGEYVISHGYIFYLRAIDHGFLITEIHYETGFGAAFASFGAMEHREPEESEFDLCKAANEAATKPRPR